MSWASDDWKDLEWWLVILMFVAIHWKKILAILIAAGFGWFLLF